MKHLLLPLLAAIALPNIAVAHPLPHGERGPLEAINHSVVSTESVIKEHGPSDSLCKDCPDCCKQFMPVYETK